MTTRLAPVPRPRSLGRLLRVATLVVAGACAGCESAPALPRAAPGPPSGARVERWDEPRRVTRRELGPSGRILAVREVLLLPDGGVVPHGREAFWYPDGGLRRDRFFLEGEPDGLWRAWSPDGAPRSSVHCGAELGTTRWWHANGRLSARGPTRRAVKEGPWTFWYENGRIAERGSYRGGQRVGEWTFWYPSGGLRERGRYRADVREGAWEAWDESGERRERAAPER